MQHVERFAGRIRDGIEELRARREKLIQENVVANRFLDDLMQTSPDDESRLRVMDGLVMKVQEGDLDLGRVVSKAVNKGYWGGNEVMPKEAELAFGCYHRTIKDPEYYSVTYAWEEIESTLSQPFTLDAEKMREQEESTWRALDVFDFLRYPQSSR